VANGRTVVYSTQILDIAEKFADVMCIVDHGRVLYLESPARLRAQAGNDDRARLELFRRLRSDREGS
jgi:ABC-2 type transport system ATP-binding protein